MIKKILEALKTRFSGVDEKILNKKAEKLAKTITKEDEIQTAVDGIGLQELIDSAADARVTEAVKTAIGNYEQKYNIKDGKPVEAPAPPPTPPTFDIDSITDPSLKAFVAAQKAQADAQAEQIKNLTTLVTGMATKNVNEVRTGKLNDILKNAPDALKKQYSADFERMAGSFKDDADFDAWLGTTKTNVEAIVSAQRAQGGIFTPPAPAGGGGNGDVNAYVQQRAQERAAMYNGGGAIKGLAQAPAPAPAPAPAQ